MKTETFKVKGMTCSGCVSNVEHTLKTIAGVHDVEVSLQNSEASVRYDELQASPDQMKSAIKAAGYEVAASGTEPVQSNGGCCS